MPEARPTDDRQLRKNVIDELDCEPGLGSARVGVAVQNGVVTLTGHVSGTTQKWMIERAVWRVSGVRAIAQEVAVRSQDTPADSDDSIAERVANMLAWNAALPPGAIRATVQEGRVRLEGEVRASHQRDAAAEDALKLAGVREVVNNIVVKPSIRPSDVRKRIRQALRRHAELQASMIVIDVQEDGAITLKGTVDNAEERMAIERAAWSAPGVRSLEDRIALR